MDEKDIVHGEKPIPAEILFADPGHYSKAALKFAKHPFCEKEQMHCPWLLECHNNPKWQCPIHADEHWGELHNDDEQA